MKSNKQALIFSRKSQSKNTKKSEPSAKENSDELTLEDVYEDFYLMAKVDGRSQKTLDLYEYVYDRFTEEIGENEPVNHIDAKEIRKYLSSPYGRWIEKYDSGYPS